MARRNREDWLQALTAALRPLFKRAKLPMPKKLNVSCGWPARGGLSTKKRIIGQCWSVKSSSAKVNEVFISPVLAKPAEVAETVVHEILHAALPDGTGHRGGFVRGMKALGLEGKPTATEAGPELKAALAKITKKLGAYPHAKMNPKAGLKKEATRLLKAECPTCGYVVRVTRKWLDEAGAPVCPTDGDQFVEADLERILKAAIQRVAAQER